MLVTDDVACRAALVLLLWIEIPVRAKRLRPRPCRPKWRRAPRNTSTGRVSVADANVAYLAVFFFRLHRPSANASSQLFGNHTACDEGVSPNGLLVVLHRFMSVGGEGTLLTQSFISPSPHLFVNADCSGGGSLELELCDAATHAVVATSATALSGDSPRVMVPLSWADESDGVGRQLQLRVVLRGGARLFSWWFESQPTVLDRLGD